MTAPVLSVEGLTKHFPVERGILRRAVAWVRAVDGVDFDIAPGETLCLVGESGCGKSTVARLVLRLTEPTSGAIRLGGTDITTLSESEMAPYRRKVQMVFQDPYASLNPRLRVGQIVGEPLENFENLGTAERNERVGAILAKVGLRPEAAGRYPFEFSGGQRQRIGIARALALRPELIVADEPVSALDVSVQAQVLNLLMDLQEEFGLAFLFVSHDLAVVEHIGHRIAVMYLGHIVEIGPKDDVLAEPAHPYTKALIAAAPVPDPRARREKLVIEGDVPSPLNPPPGCRFHTRCPFVFGRCREEVPLLKEIAPGRRAACHLLDQPA
ncbi:ABC transporter ATP-binding protein [Elioraea rosea]|uniref:ABC transporter ATP-binding protein n=1 Tax=Elioraea rosea TaxID=2492390 RepID=UPI00118346FE|nr:dipeptide ABC transporter ATP-binding protein [Elioraea rosea]